VNLPSGLQINHFQGVIIERSCKEALALYVHAEMIHSSFDLASAIESFGVKAGASCAATGPRKKASAPRKALPPPCLSCCLPPGATLASLQR